MTSMSRYDTGLTSALLGGFSAGTRLAGLWEDQHQFDVRSQQQDAQLKESARQFDSNQLRATTQFGQQLAMRQQELAMQEAATRLQAKRDQIEQAVYRETNLATLARLGRQRRMMRGDPALMPALPANAGMAPGSSAGMPAGALDQGNLAGQAPGSGGRGGAGGGMSIAGMGSVPSRAGGSSAADGAIPQPSGVPGGGMGMGGATPTRQAMGPGFDGISTPGQVERDANDQDLKEFDSKLLKLVYTAPPAAQKHIARYLEDEKGLQKLAVQIEYLEKIDKAGLFQPKNPEHQALIQSLRQMQDPETTQHVYDSVVDQLLKRQIANDPAMAQDYTTMLGQFGVPPERAAAYNTALQATGGSASIMGQAIEEGRAAGGQGKAAMTIAENEYKAAQQDVKTAMAGVSKAPTASARAEAEARLEAAIEARVMASQKLRAAGGLPGESTSEAGGQIMVGDKTIGLDQIDEATAKKLGQEAAAQFVRKHGRKPNLTPGSADVLELTETHNRLLRGAGAIE